MTGAGATREESGRGALARRRWLVAGAALLVVVLAVVFLRGRIVGAYVASALRERGVVCEGLSVVPAWDLSSVAIEPTECTLAEGPISSAAIPEGAVVALAEWMPTEITIPSVTLNPRDSGFDGDVGTALLGGAVPAPMQRALGQLAEASARPELPRVAIGRVTIGRGTVVELLELTVTRTEQVLAIRARTLGPPPDVRRHAALSVSIEALEIDANVARAHVAGRLVADAQLGPLAMHRSLAFRLDANALDRDPHVFELWIEPSPELDALRARLVDSHARVEAAGSLGAAIEERIEARASERLTKLDQLRDALAAQVEQERARRAALTPVEGTDAPTVAPEAPEGPR